MGSRKVTVQVIGTSRGADGEADCTELTVSGVYSYRNGKHFVVYEEDDGEGHITYNTVKISADSFELIKKGASGAHMMFRAGERSGSWYETPYGRLPMALDVKEVEIRLTNAGGATDTVATIDSAGVIDAAGEADITVRASYTLELGGEPVSENEVLFKVY